MFKIKLVQDLFYGLQINLRPHMSYYRSRERITILWRGEVEAVEEAGKGVGRRG